MKKNCLICVLLAMTVFSITACKRGGVTLCIQNNSKKEISNILLEFTGGRELIQKISSGEEHIININPSGESALFIKYSDENGSYKRKIDTYIEPYYKGSLIIKIQGKGTVAWEDNIKL